MESVGPQGRFELYIIWNLQIGVFKLLRYPTRPYTYNSRRKVQGGILLGQLLDRQRAYCFQNVGHCLNCCQKFSTYPPKIWLHSQRIQKILLKQVSASFPHFDGQRSRCRPVPKRKIRASR